MKKACISHFLQMVSMLTLMFSLCGGANLSYFILVFQLPKHVVTISIKLEGHVKNVITVGWSFGWLYNDFS